MIKSKDELEKLLKRYDYKISVISNNLNISVTSIKLLINKYGLFDLVKQNNPRFGLDRVKRKFDEDYLYWAYDKLDSYPNVFDRPLDDITTLLQLDNNKSTKIVIDKYKEYSYGRKNK